MRGEWSLAGVRVDLGHLLGGCGESESGSCCTSKGEGERGGRSGRRVRGEEGAPSAHSGPSGVLRHPAVLALCKPGRGAVGEHLDAPFHVESSYSWTVVVSEPAEFQSTQVRVGPTVNVTA